MKSKSMMHVALAVGACLSGAACATQPDRGTAQNTYSQDVNSDELDEVIGDRWLHSQMVIDDVLTKRDGGLLHVQFNLRNTTSRNLPIEWSIVWFDGSGFELQTSRHWTAAVVGGKGFQSLARVAPNPSASAFRLGLRKPNTVH